MIMNPALTAGSKEKIPVIKKIFVHGNIQSYTEYLTYEEVLLLNDDYTWGWNGKLQTMCMVQEGPFIPDDYAHGNKTIPPSTPTISLIVSKGMLSKVHKILKAEEKVS